MAECPWSFKAQGIGERGKSSEVQKALELNTKDEQDFYIRRWEEQRRKKLNWGQNSLPDHKYSRSDFPGLKSLMKQQEEGEDG